MNYDSEIQKLIETFEQFPSIGPKSAERLAFYLLSQNEDFAEELSDNIKDAREKIKKCSICHNFTTSEICQICQDPNRNDEQIVIVESPQDVMAIESAGVYKGKYHVLGGLINPLSNITPQKLTIASLVERVIENPNIKEIIFALSTDVEGQATALYISQQLQRDEFQEYQFKITKLGLGLPLGADLEYADSNTISESLNNRIEY